MEQAHNVSRLGDLANMTTGTAREKKPYHEMQAMCMPGFPVAPTRPTPIKKCLGVAESFHVMTVQ